MTGISGGAIKDAKKIPLESILLEFVIDTERDVSIFKKLVASILLL